MGMPMETLRAGLKRLGRWVSDESLDTYLYDSDASFLALTAAA